MSGQMICHRQFRSARHAAMTVWALLLGIAGYCLPQEVHAMSLQRYPSAVADSVLSLADIQTPSGSQLHCEIRGRMTAGLLNLQGIVLADDAFTGSYSFNLIKRGSSGHSSTAQRGTFTLVPNEEKRVGMITVNVSQGNTYHAQLQVIADDSDVTCDFTFE